MDNTSELVDKLSSMLKEKNIDINDVMKNFSTNNMQNVDNLNQGSTTDNNGLGELDFDTIMKLKSVMNKINSSDNATRNNLLNSLKPYLRNSRKDKIDSCIKLANMSNLMDLLKKDNK